MNILLFCSNPVNGGTAKVFYELTMYFANNVAKEDKIFACVNKNNPVEIYAKIPFLDRISVYSEEELFPTLYGGTLLGRVVKKFLRWVKYRSVYQTNIEKMKHYLLENDIDCVLIHNGGYVGDDLCNQMLKASFHCADKVRGRVFVMHNDFSKNLISKVRFMKYDRFISESSTELVTVSNYTRNRLLNNSYISKDISVLYNGLPRYNKVSEEEKLKRIKLDSNKRHVLMLGNFQDNKGQYVFIDAASRIHAKKPDVDFVFIGNVYDNEYYNKCIQKIKNYHLDDSIVIYHGINDAAEYISLFDVVAYPSMYDESFGLISVEAMSQSTPVVAFACGGIPEVIKDGMDGYIVPTGDSELMAERIIRILDDDHLRRQLGICGQNEYIKNFSVEAMGKRYYNTVEKYRKC